jgi:cyclophilin family peptidyl-prolyl cis-trans isomerase
LIETAEKAFVEAPNADKSVTDLLVDVLLGHVQTRAVGPAGSRFVQVQTDDYDEAWRLAQVLIDNGCEDKRIYNAAGIAAFALQHFDAAEKYLKLAQENKLPIGSGGEPVNSLLKDFLKDPARYKKAWAEEQKIRQAEAKADNLPRVLLKTNKGDIELELFEDQAPNTVANFISLVEKGFYNGLTFHRVLPGFMAQGGCPVGDGTGGPGYRIPCECYPPDKFRLHFRGSLSMAKGQARDTGGSQFFLTFLPTSHLDGVHTVFGRVIKGFEVLPKLQRRDPTQPNPPKPDKILEAKVLRKRNHAYVPTTLPE